MTELRQRDAGSVGSYGPRGDAEVALPLGSGVSEIGEAALRAASRSGEVVGVDEETVGMSYIEDEAQQFANTSQIPEIQERRRDLRRRELLVKQAILKADRRNLTGGRHTTGDLKIS